MLPLCLLDRLATEILPLHEQGERPVPDAGVGSSSDLADSGWQGGFPPPQNLGFCHAALVISISETGPDAAPSSAL